MVRRYELKPTAAPAAFVKRLEKELDEQQLAPVTSPAGAALVIAGAGSGKTRVVTHRVAYLVEGGIAPENILLATFTNRAAREMLRRAEALASRGLTGLWGGTFHHIANVILRRHAGLLGYRNDFTILDREDAKTVMKSAVAEAEVDTRARRFPQPQVLVTIESLRANTETPLKEIVERRYPFFAELIEPVEEVLSLYRLKKLAQNAMDYDDLLVNWRRVITEFAEVGDLYRRQFRAILVDEYQDTNKLQADIVDELAKGHGHLMVVGDDAQSIYSFRGRTSRTSSSFRNATRTVGSTSSSTTTGARPRS
ncbi:MAG: UvrD-helicase domain-containing protein [Planctomycetota bacterium]